MTVHPLAREVVDAYLHAADAEVPGLVEGLYLTGSAALGDFQPRTSDVDYVAVTAARPGRAELAALERAHARLRQRRRRPFFDGMYLTWDDLARDPAHARPAARSHEGRFRTGGDEPGDPVTWHTVARHGVACRGPDPADLEVWADPAGLAAWTAANLDRYWRRLGDRAAHPFSPWGLATLTPYAAVWIVTGVSRLHYTLATGDVTSKAGAGRHALQTFPERWHRVVRESLRIRRADLAGPGVVHAIAAAVTGRLPTRGSARARSLYRTPVARRRDVLAYNSMVIADAHRLHRSQSA